MSVQLKPYQPLTEKISVCVCMHVCHDPAHRKPAALILIQIVIIFGWIY